MSYLAAARGEKSVQQTPPQLPPPQSQPECNYDVTALLIKHFDQHLDTKPLIFHLIAKNLAENTDANTKHELAEKKRLDAEGEQTEAMIEVNRTMKQHRFLTAVVGTSREAIDYARRDLHKGYYNRAKEALLHLLFTPFHEEALLGLALMYLKGRVNEKVYTLHERAKLANFGLADAFADRLTDHHLMEQYAIQRTKWEGIVKAKPFWDTSVWPKY